MSVGDQVSVVIPAYRSMFVRQAVESALQQRPRPLEIILVDSSPETTLDQIQDLAGDVRHITQPPRGVSQARNAGIAAALGEYVALLDADDLWLANKLQTQLALLERYPAAGFCFSTTWNLVDGHDPGIPQEPYYPSELVAWVRSKETENGAGYGEVYELLLAVNCVATSSVVVKKTALTRVGLFDESLRNGEDYDFWLRLAAAYPAIFVCEPTSRYRVHFDGLSGSWDSRSELFYRSNIQVLEKHLANAPSAATRQALSQTLANFAGFQLKQAQWAKAREAAFRSLRLRANIGAAQHYIEATCPRLYAVAARIARATSFESFK